MKKIPIFLLFVLFFCKISAQEDYNATIRQLYLDIAGLYNEIEQTKASIAEDWYNLCVDYLTGGKLKSEELEQLINETKKEFDREDLYDELTKAKACVDEGKPYTPPLRWKGTKGATGSSTTTPVETDRKSSGGSTSPVVSGTGENGGKEPVRGGGESKQVDPVTGEISPKNEAPENENRGEEREKSKE